MPMTIICCPSMLNPAGSPLSRRRSCQNGSCHRVRPCQFMTAPEGHTTRAINTTPDTSLYNLPECEGGGNAPQGTNPHIYLHDGIKQHNNAQDLSNQTSNFENNERE